MFRPPKLWAVLCLFVLNLVVGYRAEAHLSRCSFDPSCICITWSFESGSTIEIRCPESSGSPDGWAAPAQNPNTRPDIVDGRGSFNGSGEFDGPAFLMGSDTTFSQDRKLTAGKRIALRKLQEHETCRSLFANSPLTENPEWLLSKIQWRNGQNAPESTCDEPESVATHVGQSHNIQVLLCPNFVNLNDGQAAVIILHEALHVAGQRENGDGSVGPGNPPGSASISRAVADACEILW